MCMTGRVGGRALLFLGIASLDDLIDWLYLSGSVFIGCEFIVKGTRWKSLVHLVRAYIFCMHRCLTRYIHTS